MNMKSITRVLGIVGLLVSGSIFAQTQVPNVFQAGQPAIAAEVNDNFSTLESAIDTNASDIQGLAGAPDMTGPHFGLLDSNQTELGVAMGANMQAFANHAVVWFDIAANFVPLFAYKNFIRNVQNVNIFYDGPGCTGSAFVQTGDYAAVNTGVVHVLDYIMHADGQTVLQVDSSTTIAASFMSSERTFDTGPVCSGGLGGGNVHPTIVLGTLPASTPPYSIKLVSN